QSPTTPITRPARTQPSPPRRPSERSLAIRPRRARSSASSASSPDAAVIATASSRAIRSERPEAQIAAGPTARVTIPTTTRRRAYQFARVRALLLSVRATNSSGRDGAADQAGHGDDRQDVRERLEKRGGRARVDVLERVRERGREAEEERRAERSEGPPL